jgi:thymidine phosphorylase
MPRLHIVDLLRKKRDGHRLNAREIEHLVAGAVSGSVAPEQLSAWLMASCIHGLSLE